MINISITTEQFTSIFRQLPEKEKNEILNELVIDTWLNSSDAAKLKKEREKQFKEGKTMTSKELREKIINRGY
ncbi:MAG TPA: hypothetical protein PK624_03935 [Spirochaetota bacterium]|nr:hypothetical protein [Spirochaetota bacterium]HOR43924.1 hypothetical protein [Spirochaetota bacterium]HPK55348.1 hypothetical protein [Spirochaetota bacterium]